MTARWLALLLSLFALIPSYAARCGGDFNTFIAEISREATAAGVSQAVIAQPLRGVQFDQAVMDFDAGGGILLEGLAEGAALAAVEIHHGLIELHAAERLRDHGLRDAGRCGFTRDLGDEGVEIAAAARGVSGDCGEKGKQGEQKGEPARGHELVLKYGAVAAIFA